MTERIGYIKVPSFGDPALEDSAVDAVRGFAGAYGIVIDIRGNQGGNTPFSLIKSLMNCSWRHSPFSTPSRQSLVSYWDDNGAFDGIFHDAHTYFRVPDEMAVPDAYAGQVVILVDRRIGSAAEDFVMPFHDNDRATLIGETTAGSTGQPIPIDFGHGIRVRVGTKRNYFPNGQPFEGIGVTPQVRITRRREDVYAKRDIALEAAVQAIEWS